MNRYRRDCKALFYDGIELLKDQVVIAVTESILDEYIKDRHIMIKEQVRYLQKYYEATGNEISADMEDTIFNIKSLCLSLDRKKCDSNVNYYFRLLDKVFKITDKTTIDIFSNFQIAVLSLYDAVTEECKRAKFKKLLIECDKLGIRSGFNNILESGSIDYLIEYCRDNNVSYDRLRDIYVNIDDHKLLSNKYRNKALNALYEIMESRKQNR